MAIQTDDIFQIIEIKDFTLLNNVDTIVGYLLYSKDDLINIGVNENDLNNLEILSIEEVINDTGGERALKNINNIINENYIIGYVNCNYEECNMSRVIQDGMMIPVIYRIGDNLYTFNIIQGIR